jgi:hypothetical protein
VHRDGLQLRSLDSRRCRECSGAAFACFSAGSKLTHFPLPARDARGPPMGSLCPPPRARPTRPLRRRRCRSGSDANPKTGNRLFKGRPNRPARPNLSRTGTLNSWRSSPRLEPTQRLGRITTELFPNRVPNWALRGPAGRVALGSVRAARGGRDLHSTSRRNRRRAGRPSRWRTLRSAQCTMEHTTSPP